MIYHNRILLLFSLMLSLFSCKQEKEVTTFNKETSQFNTYLQQHFSASIPDDSSCYVLISSHGCGGCVKKFIRKLILPVTGSKVHCIVSTSLLDKENLKANQLNRSVMIDESDKVDRLPYHKGNIAVIETANGEIYNYFNVEPYETDSVLTILNNKK